MGRVDRPCVCKQHTSNQLNLRLCRADPKGLLLCPPSSKLQTLMCLFCSLCGCRTDPKGLGHLFIIHGQACLRSSTKPNCSFTGGGAPPAKLYALDVKELMGGDWRVGVAWVRGKGRLGSSAGRGPAQSYWVATGGRLEGQEAGREGAESWSC